MRLDCDDSQTGTNNSWGSLPLFPSCMASISILFKQSLIKAFAEDFSALLQLKPDYLEWQLLQVRFDFDVENLKKKTCHVLSSSAVLEQLLKENGDQTTQWMILMFHIWYVENIKAGLRQIKLDKILKLKKWFNIKKALDTNIKNASVTGRLQWGPLAD